MEFNEKLQELRKNRGLTQEELATRMGYKSKSTINKIELGINDIPQSKIVQFAEVLGTTPAVLMGWDEKENAPDEPQLNEGEKMLLELFRLVPDDKQQMVLEMIRAALKTKG